MRLILLLLALQNVGMAVSAQPLKHVGGFTPADSLRGSIGPFRTWWDVTHYDVSVRPDFQTKSIAGSTHITFRAVQSGQRLQIDLQQPLEVQSVSLSGEADLHYTRDGNVVWVELPQAMQPGQLAVLAITYRGTPREAHDPPWDGGWVWARDPAGNPWMSVACQGLGASVWYPCKDTQSDEPDSAALHITAPDSLQAVGNGRLRSVVHNADGTSTWNWAVVNPINNYDLVPSIGKYEHIHDAYAGLDGPLDLDYWVLKGNEDKAREHFTEVPKMLACFEDWFGPYPFYKDGYKLVEDPFLGMEHQSAIAYGNNFRMGYAGKDLSSTGWGLKWDYIIIHESAHEWWGNSITTADIADMWVHEAFADYAEAIYTECRFGKAAGEDYVIGLRRNIRNDMPVQGPYGVNREGSTDMYYKGANMLHTIRHIMANDSLFKAMLRELNLHYRHQIVTGTEVETFISRFSGRDLSNVFDQYLRTVQVPELQWTIKGHKLYVRYSGCVPGFAMPTGILVNGESRTVPISDEWSSPAHGLKARTAMLEADRNWYVTVKRVAKSALKQRTGH
ncbi:MAG: M1 family metallopeptidase [Bacteroidetes bacterium]|nr:M1 family metallopeptidase [Bacteroidota bacterium]